MPLGSASYLILPPRSLHSLFLRASPLDSVHRRRKTRKMSGSLRASASPVHNASLSWLLLSILALVLLSGSVSAMIIEYKDYYVRKT